MNESLTRSGISFIRSLNIFSWDSNVVWLIGTDRFRNDGLLTKWGCSQNQFSKNEDYYATNSS